MEQEPRVDLVLMTALSLEKDALLGHVREPREFRTPRRISSRAGRPLPSGGILARRDVWLCNEQIAREVDPGEGKKDDSGALPQEGGFRARAAKLIKNLLLPLGDNNLGSLSRHRSFP